MFKSAVVCAILLGITAHQGNAADIRAEITDISRDWTGLSPRVQCLHEAGLVRLSDGFYEEAPEADRVQESMVVDRFVKHAMMTNNGPDRQISDYRFKIETLARSIGWVSSVPQPELKKIGQLLRLMNSIQPPLAPKDSYGYTEFLQVEIERACVEEYFAVVFGLGERQGTVRYNRALDAWINQPKLWQSVDPTYYPRSLVSLNYLTARTLLADGKTKEAFALANDSVMKWGPTQIYHSANYIASYHLMGIGTPRSLKSALEIHEKHGGPYNRIAGASIKAQLGRKQEAIGDLLEILKKTWSGGTDYKLANSLYTQLAGSAYIQPPKPGFFDVVMAIPLAILSYCAQYPAGCSGGQGSSRLGNGEESYSEWSIRTQAETAKSMQQTYDWLEIGKPDY